jgi:hypothetical protein
MFSRLLDTSLHHLLIYSRNINPLGAAASVFKAIKAHFSCSVWMNKYALTRKWEDMRVCTDPAATYNEILDLNQECTEACAGYTEFQVASKFVHLLQTAHDTAYIHLLTELARVGENASISQMWFIAQITWNQIKAVKARNSPPSQHLGMSASCQQGQRKSPSDYNNPHEPCDWCGGPHLESRCFAKDPENVWKWPQRCWVKGPPPSILKRFSVALPRDPNRFRRSAPTV